MGFIDIKSTLEWYQRRISAALLVPASLLGGQEVKLILRDPLPLDDLRAKLRKLGVNISPERDKWLVQHGNHSGLVLEKDRFYCRTCKSRSDATPPGPTHQANR